MNFRLQDDLIFSYSSFVINQMYASDAILYRVITIYAHASIKFLWYKSFRRTIEVYIHALVLILEPSQRQEAMLRYNPTW